MNVGILGRVGHHARIRFLAVFVHFCSPVCNRRRFAGNLILSLPRDCQRSISLIFDSQFFAPEGIFRKTVAIPRFVTIAPLNFNMDVKLPFHRSSTIDPKAPAVKQSINRGGFLVTHQFGSHPERCRRSRMGQNAAFVGLLQRLYRFSASCTSIFSVSSGASTFVFFTPAWTASGSHLKISQ